MISIAKGDSPQELIDSATPLVVGMNAEYGNHSNDYNTGLRRFTFTEDYKSDDVKTALINCQYDKCCFSEAKFSGDYRHVEHFRPKGRVDSWPTGNPRNYPGYYWLAYEWANLFLCKQLINVSYKKNFFPLEDDAQRNKNHNDTNVEQSVIIDPSTENPRDHIKFHQDEPTPITERGKSNIELLGLRHPDFEEARRRKLRMLEQLKNTVDLLIATGVPLNNPIVISAINELKSAIKPEAEYSSMAIDFLSGWPHLQ